MTRSKQVAEGAGGSGGGLDAEFLAKLKDPGDLDHLIRTGQEDAARKRELLDWLDASEAVFRKILSDSPPADLLATVRKGHEGVIAIVGIVKALEYLASDPSISPKGATKRAIADLASAGRFSVESPLDDLDQIDRVSTRIRSYVKTRAGAALQAAQKSAKRANLSLWGRVGTSTADEVPQGSPTSTVQNVAIDASEPPSPAATCGEADGNGDEVAASGSLQNAERLSYGVREAKRLKRKQDAIRIGSNIQFLRVRTHTNQETFSGLVPISESCLSDHEICRSIPSNKSLLLYAKAFTKLLKVSITVADIEGDHEVLKERFNSLKKSGLSENPG